MGQELNLACNDCKKVYYIGYGSTKTRESAAYTTVIQEHGTHNWVELFPEYLRMRGNDLVTDFPYNSESEDKVVIKNFSEFEKIGFDHQSDNK